MKKVTINEATFKHIMDATEGFVDKTAIYPSLEYIKIVVTKGKITAYSTNAFAASKVEVERNDGGRDEFICYIRPIKIRKGKQNVLQSVEIECDVDDCFVTVPQEYGAIKYRFALKNTGFFPNLEDVFAKYESHDCEVCLETSYLVTAMRAASSIGERIFPIVETRSNPNEPISIRAEVDGGKIKTKQLVLPKRIIMP